MVRLAIARRDRSASGATGTGESWSAASPLHAFAAPAFRPTKAAGGGGSIGSIPPATTRHPRTTRRTQPTARPSRPKPHPLQGTFGEIDSSIAQPDERQVECQAGPIEAPSPHHRRAVSLLSRSFGCHSLARFCASAIWSRLIWRATRSRLAIAVVRRVSAAGKCAVARLSHIYALT